MNGELQLVGTIVTAIVTLIGVWASAKATQDKVTSQLEVQQAVTTAEMNHINAEIAEMKAHIKEHNGYGKLFAENIPVINEKIDNLSRRVSHVEDDIK